MTNVFFRHPFGGKPLLGLRVHPAPIELVEMPDRINGFCFRLNDEAASATIDDFWNGP